MKQNIMNLAFFRNKTNILAAAALLSVTTISAQTFSDFNYRGNDKIYNDNPLKSDEFIPDSSVLLSRSQYYQKRRRLLSRKLFIFNVSGSSYFYF